MDAASAKLNEAWQAASQELYQAQQAEQAGNANPGGDAVADGGSNGGEDVTDVEFEEVEEK